MVMLCRLALVAALPQLHPLKASGAAATSPLKAVIAGGGVGGLTLAGALCQAGWEVQVVEKTSEYRGFGGPIQLASNALATLQGLDEGLFDEISSNCVRTGDRSNGLKILKTNAWLAEFDLGLPATRRGLPLTIVVDRPHLQRNWHCSCHSALLGCWSVRAGQRASRERGRAGGRER